MVQLGYSYGTARVQLGYSYGTAMVQLGYSYSTDLTEVQATVLQSSVVHGTHQR